MAFGQVSLASRQSYFITRAAVQKESFRRLSDTLSLNDSLAIFIEGVGGIVFLEEEGDIRAYLKERTPIKKIESKTQNCKDIAFLRENTGKRSCVVELYHTT